MAKTTNTKLELYQQLTEAKVEQRNQIAIFITNMDELTKMVKKLKPTQDTSMLNNGNNKFLMCKKGHKKSKCWEDKKNVAERLI